MSDHLVLHSFISGGRLLIVECQASCLCLGLHVNILIHIFYCLIILFSLLFPFMTFTPTMKLISSKQVTMF